MFCRGIRGAITVSSNTRDEILNATHELLLKLIQSNSITKEEIAFAMFTTTKDLNSEFPALAARKIGWTDTALICSHEMDVPGGLNKCIRILIAINTEKAASDIVHVYMKGAEVLRPDVTKKSENKD